MSGLAGSSRRAVVVLGLATAVALAAACGDDDDSGNGDRATLTPSATLTGNAALDVYIREAVKSNWFALGDDIEFETEDLLFEDALARAEEVGLPIYPTEPGPPPYKDGLPGVLIIARGDFYDYAGPADQTPSPDTPRREAESIAFVDELGRISYAYRFTDGLPPSTPAPTE
jgi:hypothetical protein